MTQFTFVHNEETYSVQYYTEDDSIVVKICHEKLISLIGTSSIEFDKLLTIPETDSIEKSTLLASIVIGLKHKFI